MTLFIADDSTLMRERLRNQLSGIKDLTIVGEAENGRSAIDQILQLIPDLVILDIRMPDINGIAVLQKIKAQKPYMRICILTNYDYPQYKEKCMNLGADYFLCKSRDFEQTTGIIMSMLREKCETGNYPA